MNPIRSILPVMALAAGLAGCSNPATPGASGTTAESTATVESAPPSNPGTEPSGPEAPRSGDHGVAIPVPELPIGGNADPAGAKRLCAAAGWQPPDASPADGVKVTGIWAEPAQGYRVGGSCGGLPGCAGFKFRPGSGRCSVAVTVRGNPGGAQLKFKGELTCAPERESSCRALVAQVSPGSIALFPPGGPESSTTEAPPDSPGSSPSPTG